MSIKEKILIFGLSLICLGVLSMGIAGSIKMEHEKEAERNRLSAIEERISALEKLNH